MQAIALHPKRSQVISQLTGLAALAFLSLCFPSLLLPAALCMPLFACPLFSGKTRWIACAAVIAPAVLACLYGADIPFALSLALPGALTLAVAALQQERKTAAKTSACFAYIAAYAAALCAIVFTAARALGGSLADGLAGLIADLLQTSDGARTLFDRLLMLADGAESYRIPSALTLAAQQPLASQLMLSLRLSLRLALVDLIPRLFVEVSIVCGLFTSLRVQRLNHAILLVNRRKGRRVEPGDVRVARPVGFGMLKLPPQGRALALCVGVGALVFSLSDSALTQMLGTLCSYSFQCVFRLVGAAVLLSQLTARRPERQTMFGALVAAMYLLLPTVLLVVGLLDQALHFRSKSLLHQEEE